MSGPVADWLRSSAAALEADEALRAPVASLMGVSEAAQTALATINVGSVFDLAASRVFAAAARLVEIARDGSAVEVRLDTVAADAVDLPTGVSVQELASQPIRILRDVGSVGESALSTGLDVATVRDLALWPPYLGAKAILAAAFFPAQQESTDSGAPADLLPSSGSYPTERVFMRKLVVDTIPRPGSGLEPIEDAGALDLAAAGATADGFTNLATGALLTFSQSWYSMGVTLGQLLHSTSLAPGESTRIAIVDWSRRSRAAASEDISESELLSNTMTHARSLSEVTNATATEFQSGRSTTHSESTTAQGGGGFGFDLGPVAFGGSGGVSNTTTDVQTASSSFGARDLAAQFAQQINDRSQQNASSVRNRRASIVREVSQTEHESVSTRVVTNYNHMHALTISYYEVVQAFRTTTQLEQAERCLFVPVKLADFSDQASIDRWRLVLADAALTAAARRQLTVEYGVVEVIPQTPRVSRADILGNRLTLSRAALLEAATTTAAAAPAATTSAAPASTPTAAGESPTTTPAATPPTRVVDYASAPADSAAALLVTKGWDLDQLNRLGWATGRPMAQGDSDSVFIADDALLIGCSLREGQSSRFIVRLRNGQTVEPSHASVTDATFATPLAIKDIAAIGAQYTGTAPLPATLTLHLNIAGTVLPLSVPVVLRPMSQPADLVRFGGVQAAGELVAHLQANRLHYTQAILRSLDVAAVGALLSRYTYRGIPLMRLVDMQPLAVVANTLVFKVNVTVGDAEDPRWSEEQDEWRTWLEQHGLDHPAPRSETIPLPSGGVFAEAVLGRSNAAEKVDLTRFWNWQDSPIPIVAPEIAAVQAGSRAQQETLTPGQLSAPVLSIQAPTALPDATGVAAIVNAVQNGNMFRDMSGLAQTAAIAQAALQASAQGATAVGEQAGQNMATVVNSQTERMRIAAQLIAAAMGVPTTGAGGGGQGAPAGKGTVSERGGEINTARALDEQRATQGGTPRVEEMPTPEFAADSSGSTASLQPRTITEELFRQQNGGVGSVLSGSVDKLMAALTDDSSGTGGGGSGSTGGGSGGGGGSPQTRDVQVAVQFWRSSMDQLAARQGGELDEHEVALTIWDGRGNSLLWPSKRKRGVYYEARLINGLVTAPTLAFESDEVTVMAKVRYGGSSGVTYYAVATYALPSQKALEITVYVDYVVRQYVVKATTEAGAVTKARAAARDKYGITDAMITSNSYLITYMDDPGWYIVDLGHYMPTLRFSPKPQWLQQTKKEVQ